MRSLFSLVALGGLLTFSSAEHLSLRRAKAKLRVASPLSPPSTTSASYKSARAVASGSSTPIVRVVPTPLLVAAEETYSEGDQVVGLSMAELLQMEATGDPKTVTTNFLTTLDIEDLRNGMYLGGGAFGWVFKVHVKENKRPYIPDSGFLGAFKSRVAKEDFALKVLGNTDDQALDPAKEEEGRLNEWVSSKHVCTGGTRCQCFPGVVPMWTHWLTTGAKATWFNPSASKEKIESWNYAMGADENGKASAALYLMELQDNTVKGWWEKTSLTGTSKKNAGKAAMLMASFILNSLDYWSMTHNDAHKSNLLIKKFAGNKDPCDPRDTPGTCTHWCFHFEDNGLQEKCIRASTMENYMVRLADFGSAVVSASTAANGNLEDSDTATGQNNYAPAGSQADSGAVLALCEFFDFDDCPTDFGYDVKTQYSNAYFNDIVVQRPTSNVCDFGHN
uniref:Protein kinase domain-containing protein n=1 Tax=Chromera velia CCMP2878 TaxID=1169474 RepID=A0A0K6S7E1_9ALVE|eukprot:Cvel_21528.t1-p1 / transcript=Cvel_21528.t1 / gene=Cvel_21528 / organism=Chromera_velia_CCMP2878 / gene_product=hypothetical protein / transcript_product=hypothetical protein / location=Cvel_scaffold2027:15016-17095(+) / protein_length=447 / sequence_SO=supercontig / SO=protein_coding / is_pseudo=false